MELRGGTSVERSAVAASFTTDARFVVLPMTRDPVIRFLSAYDGSGKVLTTISVNP